MKGSTFWLTVTILFSFVCFSSQQPNIVFTQYGPIDGLVYDDSRAFLGIPFAQPPVGDLRLEKPQPPAIWGPSPLWAKAYQAGCPQYCDLPPLVCPTNTSEDCLTLNVWTPLNSTTLLSPVMVFIPGGRFEDGASGTPLYNAQYLVNTSNVVVVTINYRLGALGFLVADDGLSIISNLGFLDQQLALEWVQQNIEAFGGDPTQVTVFGQSAGGTSTALHLTTPSSFGYYNKAIIESDPAGLILPTVKQADKLSRRFRDDVGCKGDRSIKELKACLQSKSIDEILDAQNKAEEHVNLFSPLGAMMPWSPVVDNIIILEQPIVALYGGHFKPVPIMLGTVLEEALMFVFGIFPNGVADYEYEAILVDVLREHEKWEKATVFYPPVVGDKNATGYRLSNLSTDFLFVCPTRNMTRSIINNLSPSQAQDVYLYRFIHVPSFYEAWGPNYTYCYFSVCHGAELPFVFHSADKVTPPYNYTAAEEVLTQQMSNYWGNFAHSGNPNQGPSNVALEWPVYQDTRLNSWENMVFGTPSYIEKNADNLHCNFWDSVGYLIP